MTRASSDQCSVRRFRTSDGYVLYRVMSTIHGYEWIDGVQTVVTGPPRVMWCDSIDPSEVDGQWHEDLDGHPIETSGERLDGDFG